MGMKSDARNHEELGQGRNKESQKNRQKTNEKSSDEQVIGVLTTDVSCVDVLDAHL